MSNATINYRTYLQQYIIYDTNPDIIRPDTTRYHVQHGNDKGNHKYMSQPCPDVQLIPDITRPDTARYYVQHGIDKGRHICLSQSSPDIQLSPENTTWYNALSHTARQWHACISHASLECELLGILLEVFIWANIVRVITRLSCVAYMIEHLYFVISDKVCNKSTNTNITSIITIIIYNTKKAWLTSADEFGSCLFIIIDMSTRHTVMCVHGDGNIRWWGILNWCHCQNQNNAWSEISDKLRS